MEFKDQAFKIAQQVKKKVQRRLHLYRSGCDAPLQNRENFQPFFIVGSGRAGTTLLRRILQASDEVHIPPEIWSFEDTYNHFLRYRSILSWEDLMSVLVRRYVVGGDFEDSFRRKGLALVQELIDLPTHKRSLARVIDTVNRHHGYHRDATFSRWGDKTPLNSFCLEEIVEVFPDAKFIHMIRDPVDVIRSYLENDRLAPKATGIESAIDRWRRAVQSVVNFGKNHGRVLDIHYEDFVHNPESEVRSICAFLGLNFQSSWIGKSEHYDEIRDVAGRKAHANVFESISTEHVGKGRRGLDAKALRRLDSLIGDECEQLGYDSIL